MPRPILFNGKFLSAAPTGVHRVAAELANALAALVAEGHPAVAGLDLRLKVPRNGMDQAGDIAVAADRLTPLTGIPWEQIALPLRKGKGTLLNLCNIGPMLSRDAVTMIHDVQVHLTPASYRPAFRLWYRLVQPIIARRHRAILTVSDFSRQEIAKLGLCPAAKVSVIPNGVDHMLRLVADAAPVAQLGLAPRGFVLALATTQAHKNIAVLLRAFARPELAGLSLVLFGGATRADFAAAGMTLPENVVLAGRVTDGELRGLIEQALCLAFPSTTEGFGLPPLEAMLLGCPAVVAPCGALPEVCGEAALYADPLADAEWADRIDALRRDEALRDRMARAGQKRAETYTWRAAALLLARALSKI